MTRKMIPVITALFAVLLLIGCASATQITASDVTLNPGGTGTVYITLDQVPSAGLGGIKLYITITDPSIADNVTFIAYSDGFNLFNTVATTPEWQAFNIKNVNTMTPARGGFKAGQIIAGDLYETSWTGGETNVVLATLTLHGLNPGTTTLDIALDPAAGLIGNDGQGGTNYYSQTTVVDGTINVYSTPGAAFTFLPLSPSTGDTVTFTDASTGGITSWDMDFGDGSAHASGPGPWTHSYSAPNTYTATLTVNNPVGPASSVSHDVVVTAMALPVADFSVAATNAVGSVTPVFTQSSTGTIDTYKWEYRLADNGAWTQFSTDATPSGIAFTTAGTYDIRLTVTNLGGPSTMTKTHQFSVGMANDRLTTIGSGTVSGDLYMNSVSPWAANSSPQTFTLPAAAIGNVQWARLFVNTYSGSATNKYGLTSIVTFEGTTIGTETLDVWKDMSASSPITYPVNDHVVKTASDYEAWYDVTSLITDDSIVVNVNNQPLAGYVFDGRIKGITLVVAYNDGDSDTVRYIVNHGSDWMNAASGPSPTTFDATSFPAGWSSANMKTVSHSGTDRDYTFSGGTPPKTVLLSGSYIKFNSWDMMNALTPADINTLTFSTTTGSFKVTTAALKADYVAAPAITSFTTSKTPASVGETITFNAAATSTRPVTWSIDFGDGSAPVTGAGPWTHSYTTANTFTVTVTATSDGGVDTETLAQSVVDVPIISITPTPQTFLPGEQRTYEIRMDKAPQGLAGYDMVVSLTDTAPADIVAVSYPTWAQMTLSPTMPADSIRIRAIDSNQQVWPAATDILLATITVRGTADGTTPIAISSLNMDADGGFTIVPVLNTGTVNIGTYSGPTAAFSAAPTSGTGPLHVVFTDSSSGGNGAITTWAWDFGDGYTSAVQNPTHDYLTVGTYTVKLTVTAPGGTDTETKTGYITVTDANIPNADFTATPTSGNYPLTVTFASTSTGNITSYAWDFNNDGVIDSVQQNPTKTYTIPGTYTVKLTVTGPGGSDTETKTDLIHATYAGPTAYFVGYPTSGLAPLDVTFSDQSTGAITSWHWVFGDGTTFDGQIPPLHTYSTTGLKTVSLTVTGPGGSDTYTRTDYINVGGNLVAAFSGTPISGFASRNHTMSVTFTDETIGSTSRLWNFGNGQSATTATATTTYTGRPQKFTVSLDVSNGADTASVTKTQYISITPYLEAFPGYTNLPTDMNADYVYEDINGNGRIDYDDVVQFYNQMSWIRTNTDVDIENFDYNFNGAIDFDDIVVLNDKILYGL